MSSSPPLEGSHAALHYWQDTGHGVGDVAISAGRRK